MYSSASQPHSIRGGGLNKSGREQPLVAGESSGLGEKVTRKALEVVGNSVRPHNTRTTLVTTTSSAVASATKTSQALSHGSRNAPTIPTTTASGQTFSTAAQTLPNLTAASTFQVSAPNHTHQQPPAPTGEPSPLIGTDSTVVRPTRSDFAALRRQHPALVPTPIPLTSELMSNPLKMATTTTNAATTGLPLLGNLPPISAVPGSKRDLVKKSTENKTFYNNTHHDSTQPLGVDKGGVKMIKRPLLGVEVVPTQPQNLHNVPSPTANTLGNTNSEKLEAMHDGNQKLISMEHLQMEVVPTSLQNTHNTLADPDKANLDVMPGGSQKLISMSRVGMEVVHEPQLQQNLRNSVLDTDKLGLRMEASLLSHKMTADLSTEAGGLVPVQQALFSHNTTGFKDSSLKLTGLTKNPLNTKQIQLDKLSKGKEKGVLDVLKITDAPSNISPESESSKSLRVYTQTINPSPVGTQVTTSVPSNVPPYLSLPSNTANALRFPGSLVYTPSDISPVSSIGSIENPPRIASPKTPGHTPTSPGASDPSLFPATMRTSQSSTGGDTESPLSASRSHSDSGEGETDSDGDCGSDSSATVTSIGPLVEFTSSYAHRDSSDGETRGEEERDGESAGEEDGEMPELEEMPERAAYGGGSTAEPSHPFTAITATTSRRSDFPHVTQPRSYPTPSSPVNQTGASGGILHPKKVSSGTEGTGRRGSSSCGVPSAASTSIQPHQTSSASAKPGRHSTTRPEAERKIRTNIGHDGLSQKRAHPSLPGPRAQPGGKQKPASHPATGPAPTAAARGNSIPGRPEQSQHKASTPHKGRQGINPTGKPRQGAPVTSGSSSVKASQKGLPHESRKQTTGQRK